MERSPKTHPAPSLTNGSSIADPGSYYDLMLRFIGRDKRVLEFGCASGYMSRMLSQSGCRVTGLELDPAAAAEARHYCENVLVADLDSRSLQDLLPETTFDVAVFGGVLEHLRDPWKVLDETRRFIAPGGFVVLSIPNVAHGSVRLSLLSGTFAYREAGLLDDAHIRFFTLDGIVDLCLRAGYRIDAIDRTKMPIFCESPYLPSVRAEDFDPVTIDRVGADPEAETFQFVVKAVPLDDARKREAIFKEFLRVRSELDALRRASRAADSGADGERRVATIGRRDDAYAALVARAEAAEAAQLALTVERAESRIELADRAFERDVAIESRNRAERTATIASAELDALREKLHDASAALSAAEARASSRFEALQSQLQFTRAEFERRTREHVRAEVDAHRVVTAYAELEALFAELQTVAARRAESIDALQARIAAYENELAARDAAADLLRAEIVGERARGAASESFFSDYLEREIASARHQASVIDAETTRYRASKWWMLRNLIRRGRGRRKI